MGSSSTSYIIRTTNESSVVSVIPVLWNALMPLEFLLLLAAGSFLAPFKEPSSIRHLSDGQIQLRQSDIKEISSYCFFSPCCWFSFRAPILPFTDPTFPPAVAEPKLRWSALFLLLKTQVAEPPQPHLGTSICLASAKNTSICIHQRIQLI